MNMGLTGHEVTIILYGRLYYPQYKDIKQVHKDLYFKNEAISSKTLDRIQHCFQVNKEKDIFQDVYFKCGVFEPSKNNLEGILMKVKRLLNYFPSLVRWKINNINVKSLSRAYPIEGFSKNSNMLNDSDTLDEQFIKAKNLLEWELSFSANSNFLEAINLAIKPHHIDQSTKHLGSQVIIVSAGTGVYKVCPDIAIPTRRRVLQTGTQIRILCLNKPPLHASQNKNSAVFIYKCFPSDHKRNAKYDPFKTKEDSQESKVLLEHASIDTGSIRNRDVYSNSYSFVQSPKIVQRKQKSKWNRWHLAPERNHQTEFDDEDLLAKDSIQCGRIHDDQHLVRHPYWIKMSYFYSSNARDVETKVAPHSYCEAVSAQPHSGNPIFFKQISMKSPPCAHRDLSLR